MNVSSLELGTRISQLSLVDNSWFKSKHKALARLDIFVTVIPLGEESLRIFDKVDREMVNQFSWHN